ncbi:MAG: uncharacterized protein JWN94_4680 [Betaproteobacteria bacterium]|nr:uncharacterized protein [Betaproteobacteria bacterium]
MNPMTHLLLASLAFLATHYVSSTGLRDVLVGVLGKAYLAAYTLIAFITLGWMIWAFYHAPFINLWYLVALRVVPLVLMPVAMLFFVCGLTTPNPTLVGKSHLLESAAPVQGIMRITRHPLMWSFALWAVGHIAARGDAAALVFFGTFAVLALSGTWLIDRRKAATRGESWQKFAAVTSNVPFAAILSGRNQLRLTEIGLWKILLSIIGYCALLVFHHALFGASATM